MILRCFLKFSRRVQNKFSRRACIPVNHWTYSLPHQPEDRGEVLQDARPGEGVLWFMTHKDAAWAGCPAGEHMGQRMSELVAPHTHEVDAPSWCARHGPRGCTSPTWCIMRRYKCKRDQRVFLGADAVVAGRPEKRTTGLESRRRSSIRPALGHL